LKKSTHQSGNNMRRRRRKKRNYSGKNILIEKIK
jgi:hypothetical protein